MLLIFNQLILTWECFAVSFLCWPGSLQPSQTIGYFRQSCSFGFLLPFPLSCLNTPPFLWRQTLFFNQLLHICLIFVFVSQRVLFLFPNDTFSTSPLARRSGGWINLLLCQVKSHLATTCSRPRWRPADCSAATGLETRPFPEPSQVLRRYPPVSGTGLESYAD